MDLKALKTLFPDWEDGLYEEVLESAQYQSASAGTTLLRPGQNIRSAILVVSGTVKLYREDPNDGEFFMYYLEPGEACAVTLVCDFHQETSQVLAKAVTDIAYLSIPLSKVDEWLRRYKSWHYFVIRTYRARYEELLQTIHSIAFTKMDERLEQYLKRQVERWGSNLKLTHQEIAADLNTSREVISRLLKKMEHDGLIILHRQSIEWVGLR
jgi:CRP/FNR family transcriptional regulator